MRIRDELGEVYADARFAGAFGVRGRPGISPGQLMMASVLQFSEDLTDRQAAEAVRDRMTWKYALGLELEDPGFDASVLSEFRSRLVAGDLTCLALDALLERLAGLGLVRGGGRQRTDSTHVLGAIRMLNRLELAGETLRAALEALAVAAPGWLAGVIDESWQQVYGARIDDLHLPPSQAGRQELMVRYGRDGYYLLEQVHGPGAPAWLRELPAVQALRQIWIQQFCREVTDGRQEVRRREKLPGGDGLPPGRDQLISPYDLDARYGIKRETGWGGYNWDLLAGLAAGVLLAWVALIAALVIARPRGGLLREALRLLPDLLRLLPRLAADRSLPRRVRVGLTLLLAYLAFPFDLVPDFIPVLGYADDAIIVAAVLRWAVRQAGIEAIHRQWPGTSDGFTALCRITGLTPPDTPGAADQPPADQG